MKSLKAVVFLGMLSVLAACVTINVYFPAAAAEKAAEEFVGDVLGEPREEGRLQAPDSPEQNPVLFAMGRMIDFLIADAHAQSAQIDINTPQINAIKQRMAQRQQSDLNPLFEAGAIGFSADGLVTIRDRTAVTLAKRRSLESVVADENRDRKAVYREIAVANGHPEWESDIQQTFAREWVQNARRGWYYQDASGAWKQK